MIVETVLGPVKPEALGRTLTHEHMHMDFTHFYSKPPQKLSNIFTKSIDLENVGNIRQYPYSLKYNLLLNDKDSGKAVFDDIVRYKQYGGGTIVENTTEGLKRNIPFMVQTSKETGVNIVAGTGFYIADMQAETKLKHSQEDLYNHMLKELVEGCVDMPTVKAGFIGEIASVWPIKDFEKKAIRAAAEVQAHIGCGVSYHPHRNPAAPAKIIRLHLEAGGKVDKTVMSHLDRTLLKDEELLEFANMGTYCQFDLFGVEVSYYQLNIETDMPSDAQRILKIKMLVDQGYGDRVLMSHDVHTKHRLTNFGGHGYSHIFNNVLPKMELKGISKETIDQITITSPANWLQLAQ